MPRYNFSTGRGDMIWISMDLQTPFSIFQPRLIVAILKETTHCFALVNGNHRAVLNTKQVSREGASDLQPRRFLHNVDSKLDINPETISCHLWLTMLLWTLQPVASSKTAKPMAQLAINPSFLHVLLTLTLQYTGQAFLLWSLYIYIYTNYITYKLRMPDFMWFYMHAACFRQFGCHRQPTQIDHMQFLVLQILLQSCQVKMYIVVN